MGRDVDSLISSMRALSMTESYAIDPYIPPITFDEAALTSTKKLRVGYLMACDPIETCSVSKRSVTMTINALKSQGHEVSVKDVQKTVNLLPFYIGYDENNGANYVKFWQAVLKLACSDKPMVSDDDQTPGP